MKNILINFKVRAKNKVFWVTFIPAVMLLIKVVLSLFGIEVDLSTIGDKLIDIVEAVFAVLAILGVVVDPTTTGIGDSEKALTYTSPGINENIEK